MSLTDDFDKVCAELELVKVQLAQANKDALRLRSILEVLPDHIMLLDVDGVILDINHTVPDLTIKDVIGTPIFQYMSEDTHAEAANCLQSVWETGHSSSYKTQYHSKDGGSQFFETKVVLNRESGERFALLAESRDITPLHQALGKLQIQTEALGRSQELANIGSWDLEIESGTLAWTDQVFRIFGLSPSEFQATYEAFLEAIHPDDRDMVNEAYTLAVENKTPYDIVHRVLRPDGGVRVVRETSRDILGPSGNVIRSMGIVHDITEQHNAQKALEEKERFLSTLVANIPGMVYRCRNLPDWPMEYLSPGCLELTGYSPSEFLEPAKRTFSSIIHSDDRERVWSAVQKAIDKTTFYEIIFRIKTAGGEDRWLWERGRGIYDENGELQALEGFVTDYSTIKNEEQSRLDLERKIMKSQKLESLGLMAGGIAHDFNNLLTIVLGNAALALQDLPATSPVQSYLEKIELASHRASDLAMQMLAYSGNSLFVVEDICINELLVELTQMMEISISRTGSLDLNLVEDVPSFEGDITQIRQVVMNLISNAGEAVEDQHGTIRIDSGSMLCDRDFLDRSCASHLMMYEDPIPEGRYVFIEVTDTGSGMDQTTLDKIFDPFFTTKFTGRGLGLAATLGIIRGHKGTLKVNSELGKGTTFKVLFPSRELVVQPETTPDQQSADENWQGEGLVLLADDEDMVRELGGMLLERLGFKVIMVADGLAATREFEKHADEISLVLLDLTMPVLNGKEAFHKIIKIKPDAKVILCTGFSENESVDWLKGGALSGYLQKPFSYDDLCQEVKRVLG